MIPQIGGSNVVKEGDIVILLSRLVLLHSCGSQYLLVLLDLAFVALLSSLSKVMGNSLCISTWL